MSNRAPLFTAEDHEDMRELANAFAMATAGIDRMVDRLTKRESDRPLFPPRQADWR